MDNRAYLLTLASHSTEANRPDLIVVTGSIREVLEAINEACGGLDDQRRDALEVAIDGLAMEAALEVTEELGGVTLTLAVVIRVQVEPSIVRFGVR